MNKSSYMQNKIQFLIILILNIQILSLSYEYIILY